LAYHSTAALLSVVYYRGAWANTLQAQVILPLFIASQLEIPT
jgi:hypothetical protein